MKQRFVGGHPLGVGGVRDEGKQFYTDSQPMTSPSLLSDGENSSKDSALITQH